MASSIETTSTTTTLKNNGNTYMSVDTSDNVTVTNDISVTDLAVTGNATLTNPLPVASGGTGVQSITATVAASALTLGLDASALNFRSTTLGSGTVTPIVNAALSLVVPSTATLGTVSATQSRLILLAINNAGTTELAVVNIAGGNSLDESGLVSTTAIGAGSDSNNVIYSTTARTSVAYRVVGYVESTQGTAGTWATAPSTIQGSGGNALTAMGSLGYGQTWQSVLGSRSTSTTYTNSTGKPITVIIGGISVNANNSNRFQVVVNGLTLINFYGGGGAAAFFDMCGTVIVPAGGTYSSTTSGGLRLWMELR